MPVHMIIAHPSAMFRRGLSAFFSREADILTIDEVATREELERKLRIEPVDVVIIEQSLIRDISLWPDGTVVVMAREADRECILAAVAHGARGYFLETSGDEKE